MSLCAKLNDIIEATQGPLLVFEDPSITLFEYDHFPVAIA